MKNATPEQIAAAFTEWMRRYQTDPEGFQKAAKLLSIAPGTYGGKVTPYFLEILAEIQGR